LAALLVAGAALSLALAGCGSGSLDPVAQAATTSAAAAGYRINFTLQISSPTLPAPITATGRGRFDRPARSGSLTLDMNLGGIPQVSQVLGSSQLRLEELISGTTVYIRLPAALRQRIPTLSAPWLKIDLVRAGSSAGIPGLGSLFNNPTSTDPSQLLNYLRATSGGVTKVGTATVNGLQTTEYRAELNLDKVPNLLPSAQQAQARQAIAALERLTGVHQIPVEAWIDAGNLVRRTHFTFDEKLPTGQSLAVGITADIVQYGPQPPPVLPPASQVTDLTGKVGGGTSNSGSGGGGYFPGG
jgi:hypothetical protein